MNTLTHVAFDPETEREFWLLELESLSDLPPALEPRRSFTDSSSNDRLGSKVAITSCNILRSEMPAAVYIASTWRLETRVGFA